jgi:DNA mismatch repair protein MutL
MYAFVNSAVKHALSKNSIAPSLDFTLDSNITNLPSIAKPFTAMQKADVQNGYLHNSFKQSGQAHLVDNGNNLKNWKEAYSITNNLQRKTNIQIDAHWQNTETATTPTDTTIQPTTNYAEVAIQPVQLLHKYIAYPKQNGFLLINIKAATERIVYNKLQEASSAQSIVVQNCLHPQTFTVDVANGILLHSILPHLLELGYAVEDFGNNTFIIQGTPADIATGAEVNTIMEILEQHKNNNTDATLAPREKLMRTIAWQQAQHMHKVLSSTEIKNLCDQLFVTSQPQYTPRGQKIFTQITEADIEKYFKND